MKIQESAMNRMNSQIADMIEKNYNNETVARIMREYAKKVSWQEENDEIDAQDTREFALDMFKKGRYDLLFALTNAIDPDHSLTKALAEELY